MFQFFRDFSKMSRFLTKITKRAMTAGPSRGYWAPIDDTLLGLTEDQQQLRETCHKFFVKELDEHAGVLDHTNTFDDLRPFWKKLGDMGLLGITCPAEYGGSEMTYSAFKKLPSRNFGHF